MDKPTVFHDFPEDHFPFTVTVLDPETGELLWEQVVEGPGVLNIPGYGRRAVVVVEFADGTFTWAGRGQ